jgi:hypothetical protein
MPSEYRIPSNQSLFDASINLYGDVSYCVKLMLENDFVESIDFDVSGQVVEYDPEFKEEVLGPLTTVKLPAENLVQTWKPYEGQTIFDIALQIDGGLENIISVIANSTLNNINSGIIPSSRFDYQKKKSALLDWVEKTGYIFVTGTVIEVEGREHDSSYERISHT